MRACYNSKGSNQCLCMKALWWLYSHWNLISVNKTNLLTGWPILWIVGLARKWSSHIKCPQFTVLRACINMELELELAQAWFKWLQLQKPSAINNLLRLYGIWVFNHRHRLFWRKQELYIATNTYYQHEYQWYGGYVYTVLLLCYLIWTGWLCIVPFLIWQMLCHKLTH